MENYKKQMQEKIQSNCTLKSEDYKVCGKHHSWDVIDNQPIHVLIDDTNDVFTILIGYDIWRVPVYLNRIFSMEEIETALMQEF